MKKQIDTYMNVRKRYSFNNVLSFFMLLALFQCSYVSSLCAQTQNAFSDDKMLNDYINSKGYSQTIVFDHSNIKQYWIDNSVLSRDESIVIMLNQTNSQLMKSKSFKIQLSNVYETQDCKIDVIAESADFAISVSNSKSKEIASFSPAQFFLTYHVASTTIHLDDIPNFSINFNFSSSKNEFLSIKKIVLSFTKNKDSKYSGSPGFDALSKTIEKDGINVPNSDVKFIISKEYNKIFFMIPDEIAKSYLYLYHITPTDKKDVSPNRVQYGFNNLDFSINSNYTIIPKPYNSDSKFTIIQQTLPKYRFASLTIGQYEGKNKIWILELKEIP